VLNTLVRAPALDSYSYQGVCCVCVWRPSAKVPTGSIIRIGRYQADNE